MATDAAHDLLAPMPHPDVIEDASTLLADPEAAAWIFTNKALAAKTTLIPLDVTHQVLATKEIQSLLLWGAQEGGDRIGSAKTTLRTMLVELLLFFAKTYRFGCHNT